MAAPIVMSFFSRCGTLLRVQSRCLSGRRPYLLTNESTGLLTACFISSSSMGKPLKLCSNVNKHGSLALGSTLRIQVQSLGRVTIFTREYSSSSTHAVTDAELKKHMESLADSFMETRELLDDARNSFGSVYFNEDLQEAEDSLNDTLQRYAALLEKLSDSQKEQVQRSIGLKMEELKAQRQVIQDIIRED